MRYPNLPLLLIPVVGTYAGGGALGYGIVETISFLKTTHVDFEVLADKIPLLRFGIAVERLENASSQINYLLEEQKFKKPTRFAALENDAREVDFLLESVTAGGFFRREKVSLKPIAIPPKSS